MMKFTAVNTKGDRFTFEAANEEKAQARVEKAFEKHGFTLAELINNTEGTKKMFGSAAIAWLYEEN